MATFTTPTRSEITPPSAPKMSGTARLSEPNRSPGTGIVAPAPGAVVPRPPVVAWSAVKGARFYNVQLWRGKAKLLTTWPSGPLLRLHDTWRFSGVRQQLRNGKYELFVWPAYGTLAKPQYGKLVGRVDFVVKRR